MIFADIVLPVAREPFTFSTEEVVAPGQLVQVRLGKRRHMTGVVWRVHSERPSFAVKPIQRVLATRVSELQMRFWEWMADYYMCTVGEVMAAALPAALRPEGLSEGEFSADVYRPRREMFVSLRGDVNASLDSLSRAPKQYRALLEVAELSTPPVAQTSEATPHAAGGGGVLHYLPPQMLSIPRKSLSSDLATLKALEQKGFLVIDEREITNDDLPPLPRQLPVLSKKQQEAAGAIRNDSHETTLLYGVTGSGKTEIYITLIAQELAKGRNVLYLVPEIAMSSQLVARLRKWFGTRVIAWHSRVADDQRAAIYNRVAKAKGVVVLGARSATLLPLQNLGLMVVDEEHDPSYKQQNPAPRYHGRDAALVLAQMQGAHALLGSATPALESYANALSGKYGLVTLTERWGGAMLPQILLSDTLRAVQRGERTRHFNKALLDRLKGVLGEGRQAMLFQNRRGFAPYIECTACGAPVMCRQCNVALTLHKAEGVLRCHYCGRSVPIPAVCPTCGQAALEPRGFGTEKVEEELARLLPEARIARLDGDVAGSRRRYEGVIAAFESGAVDVLVGTQMITKGFDFGGVGLVGVLNADNLLAFPDFRAPERAFQTITQVAGRAGRRACALADSRSEPGGDAAISGGEPHVLAALDAVTAGGITETSLSSISEVVIQTAQPQLPILRQAASGDYAGMAREQLSERAEFLYPPYCRLIEITLRARDAALLWESANQLAARGRELFGALLLGPQPAAVDKIRNEHIVTLLLKVERAASLKAARDTLRALLNDLAANPRLRKIRIHCNPDPQ